MPAPRDLYLSFSSLRCSEQAQPVDDVAFPTSVHLLPHTYRHAQLGLISPTQRLMDELVHDALAAHTRCDTIAPDQQALVMAAGNCIFAGMQNRKRQAGGFLDYQSKTKYVQTTQIQAGRLAQQLGTVGHISTDTSACASSMKALMDALHLIQCHGFERVAVLVAEDQVSLGVLEFFGDMQLCLGRDQLQQGQLPSAFDAQHQGFLIGQGAALIWLETEAALEARKAPPPRAKLLSAVTCGEACDSPLGQDPQGSGYLRAMRWALRQAQREPGQIDLIKTHGTGTRMNNVSEATAIHQVFGENFVATAYKPRIGHTLGASGLIESLLALQDAQQQRVRAIPHRTAHDARFLSHDLNMPVHHILALSAGMGNVYGAAVWELLPE
jgi:3-oxoacyl-(acyl-carrier-protein) synthase